MKKILIIISLITILFSGLFAQKSAHQVGRAPLPGIKVNTHFQDITKSGDTPIAFVGNSSAQTYCSIDLLNGNLDSVGFLSSAVFPMAEEFDGTNVYRLYYDMSYGTVNDTGAFNQVGTMSGDVNGTPTGLAFDHVNQVMYVSVLNSSNINQLATLDLETGILTAVGSPNGGMIIAIDFADDGMIYGPAIDTDSLYKIDPATGISTAVGYTGVNLNYGQDVNFDPHEEKLYTIICDLNGDQRDFGFYDLSNGAFNSVSATTNHQFATFVIKKSGPFPKQVFPGQDAVDVIPSAEVKVVFGKPIYENDLSSINITPDPGNVSASIINDTLFILHDNFDPGAGYTVHLPAGCINDGIHDLTDEYRWSFTTLTCQDPVNPLFTDITISSASLSWTENGSATTWNVIIGEEGFDPDAGGISSQVNADPEISFDELTSGTIYDVLIQSVCADGIESSWIGPLKLTTLDNTSLQQLSKNSVKLYPNPSNGNVNISVSEASHIRLIDIYGRTIREFMLDAREDFSFREQPGIYYLQVNDQEGSSIYKLFIQ